MEKVKIEFCEERIVFESNGNTTSVKESTLINHTSPYIGSDQANLIHAIISQHINCGVDVTSAEYCNGVMYGIMWYCFHESR